MFRQFYKLSNACQIFFRMALIDYCFKKKYSMLNMLFVNYVFTGPPHLPLDPPVQGSNLGPGAESPQSGRRGGRLLCINKLIKLGPGWLQV